MLRCNRHRYELGSVESKETFDGVLRTVQGILDIDDDANDGDEAGHRDIRLWVTGTEEVSGGASADAQMSPAAAALATTAALRVAAVRRCVEMSQAVAHTLAEEAAALNREHASSPAPHPSEGWGGGWGGVGSAGVHDGQTVGGDGSGGGGVDDISLVNQVSMLSRLQLLESAEGKVGAIRVEATQRLAELTTLVAAHLHALAMSLTANDSEDGYEWSSTSVAASVTVATEGGGAEGGEGVGVGAGGGGDVGDRSDGDGDDGVGTGIVAIEAAAEWRARLVRQQVAAMLRDVQGLVSGVAAALVSATDGADAALLGYSRNEAATASEATVRGGGDGGGDVAGVDGGSGDHVADSHSGDNGSSSDNGDNGGGVRRASEGDGGGVSSVPAVVSVGRAAREALLADHETAVGYIADGTQSLVFIVMAAAVDAATTADWPSRDELAVSAQSQPFAYPAGPTIPSTGETAAATVAAEEA